MKNLVALMIATCSIAAQAAVSDMLFVVAETNFSGTPGNICFDGSSFVTPVVQSNGAIELTFLNTNGVVVSNISLGISGTSPRIALNGDTTLVAWIQTNALLCAAYRNDALNAATTLVTNVAPESVTLRERLGKFLAVWQTADSNSAVKAQWIGADAQPIGASFFVGATASAQRFPSVNVEGTNCLVVWMEQNVSSNDWRVLARFVEESGPTSAPIQVSQTNSLRAYPTACSFGTNFFVAWSWDAGPFADVTYDSYPPYQSFEGTTNTFYPVVLGRIVSQSGNPVSNSFRVARLIVTNTYPAITHENGRFIVVSANNYANIHSLGVAQIFTETGARIEPPFRLGGARAPRPQAIAFGAGRVLVLSPDESGIMAASIVGRESIADLRFVNLRRTTNGSISAEDLFANPIAPIELSTNLIDWTYKFGSVIGDLPKFSGERQLFVRLFDGKWRCIEQLRAIDFAKQTWAADYHLSPLDMPGDYNLFGSGSYLAEKPVCPQGGTYTLNNVGTAPICSISGHRLSP